VGAEVVESASASPEVALNSAPMVFEDAEERRYSPAEVLDHSDQSANIFP
jgi:hypothetical protein